MTSSPQLVAYFSMEIAVSSELPTYAGGLGVLAGDHLRAAADSGVAMVGVTLLYRKGYFRQVLDAQGHQQERDVQWLPEHHLERVSAQVVVTIEGREVKVAAWCTWIHGVGGGRVPVYMLDTDVDGNGEEDRRITDHLYGGEERYRLQQEAVLGIGGRRLLAALELAPTRYHLNEGHSSLLALDMLSAEMSSRTDEPDDVAAALAAVRSRCVFTTHTPIPAGHDRFPKALATAVLGRELVELYGKLPTPHSAEINMSALGIELSGFVNAVSHRHAEVSSGMFPGHPVHAITNGVHSTTWTAPAMRAVFDRWIPEWRRHGHALRQAQKIPTAAIVAAHREAKRALIDEINRHGDHNFGEERFTIGFARRATAYKRMLLILRDVRRLREIASRWGTLQIVFAGKAHPRDLEGKRMIEAVFRQQETVLPAVRIAFVPGYDMRLGGLITAGVDLWLNTPMAPLEASGTSGMKAAHNGVPNLSVRDGWWCEGYVEGQTGWVLAPGHPSDDADAAQLYRVLDEEILPLYLGAPERWAERMRASIALAASYFNAHRMVGEYVDRAYAPAS
ncbi:alpha-glucan family phosphorylase [Nannocystis radixulma]|uniref:Alpha-glucan family phosphorylase n=1 Tax=Nannocystis radixulma TaxID=2995305 RepID=A0ABT5BCP1_9BACT|nr:alpha-glucan family phosphorylase [Nannocystis radixulma]MDC0671904.1 alpha-glucan family phosphorylase [Nannocystis radixulma]